MRYLRNRLNLKCLMKNSTTCLKLTSPPAMRLPAFYLLAPNVSSCSSKAFGECSHHNIHIFRIESKIVHYTPATGTQGTYTVSFIKVQIGFVLLLKGNHFRQTDYGSLHTVEKQKFSISWFNSWDHLIEPKVTTLSFLHSFSNYKQLKFARPITVCRDAPLLLVPGAQISAFYLFSISGMLIHRLNSSNNRKLGHKNMFSDNSFIKLSPP